MGKHGASGRGTVKKSNKISRSWVRIHARSNFFPSLTSCQAFNLKSSPLKKIRQTITEKNFSESFFRRIPVFHISDFEGRFRRKPRSIFAEIFSELREKLTRRRFRHRSWVSKKKRNEAIASQFYEGHLFFIRLLHKLRILAELANFLNVGLSWPLFLNCSTNWIWYSNPDR